MAKLPYSDGHVHISFKHCLHQAYSDCQKYVPFESGRQGISILFIIPMALMLVRLMISQKYNQTCLLLRSNVQPMGLSLHPDLQSGPPNSASCLCTAHKQVRLSQRESHGLNLEKRLFFYCVIINRMIRPSGYH